MNVKRGHAGSWAIVPSQDTVAVAHAAISCKYLSPKVGLSSTEVRAQLDIVTHMVAAAAPEKVQLAGPCSRSSRSMNLRTRKCMGGCGGIAPRASHRVHRIACSMRRVQGTTCSTGRSTRSA